MVTLGSTARPWRRLVPAALALSLFVGGCGREHKADGPGVKARVDAMAPEPGPAAPPPPIELNVGEAVERSILPGESHEYRLYLQPGDFFEFEVEQQGIDVELSLLDPQGQRVLVMDLPIADLGPESILAVAEQEGGYVLRVKAWPSEDPGGSYLATLVARRRANGTDEQRGRAAMLFYRGEVESGQRLYREAIEWYTQARALWAEAGDEFWRAVTLDREGYAWSQLGELAAATALHEQAAKILGEMDEPRLAAINANHLAEIYFQQGRLDRAIEQHRWALALRRQTGDRRGEGMTLGTLGRIFGVRGDVQPALDHYQQALDLLDQREDRRYRATALHDLGTLYHRLGKNREAVERLQAAERIYAELEIPADSPTR